MRAQSITTIILLSAAVTAAADTGDGRFVAVFEDGRRVTGPAVENWARPGDSPRLGGRALADPAKPVRWLCDTSLTKGGESPPAEFVELHNGDRLPGVVVAACRGPAGDEALAQPPHLVVRPPLVLRSSRNAQLSQVRVITRMVRRIVHRPGPSDRYRPNTLRYSDGRRVRFLGARFAKDSVLLLLDAGTARVSFDEIAELHLPPAGPWEVYFDELAALCPDLRGRLVQLSTTTGLIATTSTQRFRAMSYNTRDDPGRWYHLIHPAWSLDAMAVCHGEVRMRRYWPPADVPLPRIAPARSASRAVVYEGWRCRVNRNVLGGPLHSGRRDYGWGFGVHGESELEFPLPSIASGFRTRFGLDREAGEGGCVRTRVCVRLPGPAAGPGADKNHTLHTSGILIGSRKTADTAILPLPGRNPAGPRRLVLWVDPVSRNFPPGADPLDIRDTVDWLEPVVQLDRGALWAEVRRRYTKWLPAWDGWTLAKPPPIELVGHWDAVTGRGANYRFAVQASRLPLILTRKVTVTSADSRLRIAASCLAGQSQAARIQVRVAGKTAIERDVHRRYTGQGEPPTIAVPLGNWLDRTVAVEIVLLPAEPGPNRKLIIDWRRITLTGCREST